MNFSDVRLLPSISVIEREILPDIPAVYFAWCEQGVVYIGEAQNLNIRWRTHHKFHEINEMDGCRISWIQIESKKRRIPLEAKLINEFRPVFNKAKNKSNRVVLVSSKTVMLRVSKQTRLVANKALRDWKLENPGITIADIVAAAMNDFAIKWGYKK